MFASIQNDLNDVSKVLQEIMEQAEGKYKDWPIVG